MAFVSPSLRRHERPCKLGTKLGKIETETTRPSNDVGENRRQKKKQKKLGKNSVETKPKHFSNLTMLDENLMQNNSVKTR